MLEAKANQLNALTMYTSLTNQGPSKLEQGLANALQQSQVRKGVNEMWGVKWV